ncbi:MAG: helix-turn-helix transcriptional regulator [Firmicutes bacterium]|nr:helix-turn-helix transcriptional regulator [Bacillota bacterium]
MFIQRLEELIAERKLTISQLSKSIGIPPTTMYSWQNGIQPTAEKLVKLADYFGVTIDYLVGREDEDGVVRIEREIEKRKELRPSTLKLVQASEPLNDMGIAVVIGYIARLIEENPEFLQIRRQ